MTASNWPASIKAVLASEGGYVNDPRDPGGETRYGISKRSYPDVDIKDLTPAAAEAIYERDYWNKIDGDALPTGVDYAVLDFAVNSGVGTAVKALQGVCGVAQDGIIGPQTLHAVSVSSAPNIISQLCDRRMAMLQSLPTWKTFGKGWTNRIVSVKLLATQMAKTALSP